MPRLPQTTGSTWAGPPAPPAGREGLSFGSTHLQKPGHVRAENCAPFSSWKAKREEKLPRFLVRREARSFQKALAGRNKPPSFSVLFHILNRGHSSILRDAPASTPTPRALLLPAQVAKLLVFFDDMAKTHPSTHPSTHLSSIHP